MFLLCFPSKLAKDIAFHTTFVASWDLWGLILLFLEHSCYSLNYVSKFTTSPSAAPKIKTLGLKNLPQTSQSHPLVVKCTIFYRKQSGSIEKTTSHWRLPVDNWINKLIYLFANNWSNTRCMWPEVFELMNMLLVQPCLMEWALAKLTSLLCSNLIGWFVLFQWAQTSFFKCEKCAWTCWLE